MKASCVMNKVAGLLLSLLLFAAAAFAAEGDGGYAAPFLQLPIGARPSGMGGAYLAVSDDGAGVLFNPAGICGLARPLFATSYRSMNLDRKLGYATAIVPARNKATVGVHWLYAGSGSVAARDANGEELGHDISFNSHVFSVVFSKQLTDVVAVGSKMNYFVSNFPKVTATTIGFDFGALFMINELINRERRDKFPVKDLRVGVTLKNAGAQFRWNSEKYTRYYTTDEYAYQQNDRIPIEGGLGVSGKFLKRKLLAATDVRMTEHQHLRLYCGGEYALTPQIFVRSGLSDKRFTAGTGFLFKFSGKSLAIDYAFANDRVDEGSDHIISFDMYF